MMLFKAPALFFTLIAACVAAPTSPPTSADPEVARRWYSIPEDQEVFQEHTRPWPVGKDGLRTINYCFEDVYSYHQISNILELGLAKWEPATRVSALRFAPDPACEQEPCLCDEPHVAEVSLHIGLATRDQAASASVGYNGPETPGVEAGQPQNRLLWPTNDPFFYSQLAPLLMAHELGEYEFISREDN
jgi:hypothetical protein